MLESVLRGQQADLVEERHVAGGSLGLALIRDGNGTPPFETLLRYPGAAMAEFWRALKTLQAEQAVLLEQAERALPSGVFGPRDLAPLRRLATARALLFGSAALFWSAACVRTLGAGTAAGRQCGTWRDTLLAGEGPAGGGRRVVAEAPGGLWPRKR